MKKYKMDKDRPFMIGTPTDTDQALRWRGRAANCLHHSELTIQERMRSNRDTPEELADWHRRQGDWIRALRRRIASLDRWVVQAQGGATPAPVVAAPAGTGAAAPATTATDDGTQA